MLKKVSRILYYVAFGISIFAAVVFIGGGIASFVFPNTPDFGNYIRELYNAKEITLPSDMTIDQFIEGLAALFIIVGVFLVIGGVSTIINGVLSFKAARSETKSKKIHIANIVFGLISAVEVNVVAAILGLIALANENKKK